MELQLGLIEGATPALADYLGRRMAEAGATQNRVLAQLKEQCGVCMRVKRLRKLVAALSAGVSEHRQTVQVEALLTALRTAQDSRGNRKPVLAVGRDGITLCEYTHRFWEIATTATVTVFDRAGKRLTTICLAVRPELGQATMSGTLTALLTELLKQWEGPLPSLAYVADSGGKESSYFEEVLAKMRHPLTRQRLPWQRVVDFYHAAERVWAMADALFGSKSSRYRPWALRMLKTLRKRHHGGRLQDGPYPTRLKLSGMRWKRAGAQQILNLRTMLLSRTWQAGYRLLLATRDASLPIAYAAITSKLRQKAA